MVDSTPNTIAIVGATASGKSAIAWEFARKCQGEIINCDSVQVYRGFDVGTAKPTAAERRVVPHHLIDCCDWNEDYDAARFAVDAQKVIHDIRSRGKRAIVCGGTGLYLRSLRFGLIDVPKADEDLRRRLVELEQEKPGALMRQLFTVDPETAESIDPNNVPRVVRALEIFELTGKGAAAIRREHGFQEERVPMQVWGIAWDREALRERIGDRIARMMAAGFMDEVAQLRAQGVPADCRPMRSVGYRQVCEVVDGQASYEGLEDRIFKATWDYARRQRVWFNKEPDVTWVAREEMLAAIMDRQGSA